MVRLTLRKIVICLIGAIAQTSCSIIDEDLSDCDNGFRMDYELRLVTNITTELQTQLSTQMEVPVATALRSHLRNVFTDYATDVDLSFYDIKNDSARLEHIQVIMNDSAASYTMHLPAREYQHLAVANVNNNNEVNLVGTEACHTSALRQTIIGDTIDSQTTGLYTARLHMEVQDSIDQSFNIRLFMVNSAASLVIDTTGINARRVWAVAKGFATTFNVSDSVYTCTTPAIVRAKEVTVDDGSLPVRHMCFCAVNFPTPSSADTRTRIWIETEEPFIADPDTEPIWQYDVFVELPNGDVTKSELKLYTPLYPGQLGLIKARLLTDGSLQPKAPEVSASVTFNWQEGLEIIN